MALVKASFTSNRAKAYGGMIADTSLYNIDGCNVASGAIPVGTLVAFSSLDSAVKGHKIVKQATAASDVVHGVATMSHYESPTGVYEDGDVINVMTHGRVWVLAEKAITEAQAAFRTAVTFNKAGVVAATGGIITTNFTFTGELLDTDDANYKLAKIQLVQDAPFVPAAAPAASA